MIERRGLQTDVLQSHHPAPHPDPQLLPWQVDDVLPEEALQQRSEEVLEHHPRDPDADASPRVRAAPLPGPIVSNCGRRRRHVVRVSASPTVLIV